MKIEDIDKNFATMPIEDFDLTYYDISNPLFKIEGLPYYKEEKRYNRLPKDLTAEECNEGVISLGHCTAGGAVRFCTDSPIITVKAKLTPYLGLYHMTRLGCRGFDIYMGSGTNKIYSGCATIPLDTDNIETIICRNLSGTLNEWQINFPLYGGFEALEIGLIKDSILSSASAHTIEKPILFYGSSITQGGCASHPGNAYSSILCREVDAEQINFGFSGSGRGEARIAELISEQSLSCFVLDYDHNAPSLEHLSNTHEKFFNIVRSKNPTLPIIILTKCDISKDFPNYEENVSRRSIIYKTYENAIKNSDKNVWFIDGETLFGRKNRHECTVDKCHPNDLGFYRMFKHILPTLKEALAKNN